MHIEEVEAIWSAIAERDDWQPFNNKVKAIRRMGDAIEGRMHRQLTKQAKVRTTRRRGSR